MPTLYGAPVSPFARKVMVALAEKGITYEHDPVVPAIAPAEFKRVSKDVSPLGGIPPIATSISRWRGFISDHRLP